MKRLSMCLILSLFFVMVATAEEDASSKIISDQIKASGVEDLWNSLPQDTIDTLKSWGIDSLSTLDPSSIQPNTMLTDILSMFTKEAVGPLTACGIVLGITMLCGWLEGMQIGERSSAVFSTVGSIASYMAVLTPLLSCLYRVTESVDSTAVFMTSYIPVYAGVMMVGGQAATAASYQTIVLFAAELMTILISRWVMPCLIVSMALGLCGSVTPSLRIQTVGTMFSKVSVWVLSLSATIFTGLLSLQSFVSSSADSLGGRAVRFSLSSFVPVVGGALGEALNTVRGCLGVVRSTIGAIGIVITVLILLPPILECVCWCLCLSFCHTVSDMMGVSTLAGLFRTSQSIVKTMIGVLSICGLFLIIGTTIVTIASGHTG